MNTISLTRTVDPQSEPVTLLEAKKQLEIAADESAHNAQINDLIKVARVQVEDDTGVALMQQTFAQAFGGFESEGFHLAMRPVASISSVQYYDANNASQPLSTDVYALDAPRRMVRLKYDQEWPDTVDRFDAVTVTFVAGYSTAADVPATLKQAMLLLIPAYFEGRSELTDGERKSYEWLIGRHMRPSYP